MNAILGKTLFAAIFSFLVTFYLVPFFCALARRLKFVDVPDGKIKVHKQSTPYMGGVAVYVGFISALCIAFPFESNTLFFFIGTTLLLFVGLIDDLMVLQPYQKFFGQILATLCFLKAGFYLKSHFFSSFWSVALSAFWILSITNAFNLVDVMDGLASILAICSIVSFFAIALFLQQYTLLILLGAFLGAVCAFFWYNKPTAHIYLGDAGSLFIGGFLATVPFLINWGTYNTVGYLAPIVILAIPLLEVSTLVLVRTYKGIPFYNGSPDHFSIYLQNKGWSKWAILGYVIALSGILFVVALLFVVNSISLGTLCCLAAIFLILWYTILFSKKER